MRLTDATLYDLTTPRGRWHVLWVGVGLLLVSIACLALLDRPIVELIGYLPGPIGRVMGRLTDVGKAAPYLIAGAVGAVAGWLIGWRRLAGWSLLLFASVAVSGILVNIAKPIIGRLRPIWLGRDGSFGFDPLSLGYEFASFPSGHSATAGAVGVTLALAMPKAWRWWLGFAIVIGMTRIFTRSHYPSDVIMGLYVGGVTALALRAMWQRYGRMSGAGPCSCDTSSATDETANEPTTIR